VPTPPTWAAEDHAQVGRLLMKRMAKGERIVVKPLFGSQGKGLLRVDRLTDLPLPEAADNIYYLQDFVPPTGEGFEDWRVIATRSRVVAAMGRKAGTWITNVHQGGSPVSCEPTREMRELAAAALAAVDADYAGVDLIRGPDGRLMVIEVNSNPSWRGLQSVTDVDVAEAIVEDFLAAVGVHQRARRCPA